MNKKFIFKINIVFAVIFLNLLFVFPLSANANSENNNTNLALLLQQKMVTIDMQNVTLSKLLIEIKRQTELNFIYKNNLSQFQLKDVKASNIAVEELLAQTLSSTGLSYELNGNSITIIETKPIAQNQESIEIKGKVVDADGNPVAGATIVVIGTSNGAITDGEGAFSLECAKGSNIEITFTGLKSQTVTLNESNNNLTIKMELDEMTVEEVIVTGFFERKTNTFTGAAKTVSGEQLRQISSTNIMNALAIVDPSIQIVQNNEQGSNPNNIPELIIRGTSSLNASNEAGLNSPLIVIDGVESDLRALYDMEPSDIQSITVLKDASATALYGEQAANGVILITRLMNRDKALRVSYNFTGKVEFPDVSAYNLMNAREKLDYELYAGVYDDNTGDNHLIYAEKEARVNAGIDTDWLAKPLRTSFSNSHNINVSGEGSGIYYKVSGRYSTTNGVMKDDNRTNTGVGVYFSHNLNQKLITTLRADFSQYTTKDSKYGEFSDYVNANPYDAPYDANENLYEVLSYDIKNPLYEASLSSFATTKSKELTASLNIRWNIMDGLYIVGFGSIESADSRSDEYISPLSGTFINESNMQNKGSYTIEQSPSESYYGRFTANFNRNLDNRGSILSVNIGGEARRDSNNPYGFSTYGFFNDKLTDITFGSGFKEGDSATGVSTESTSMALVGSMNLTFRNRYFIDASYRLSGSSKFGSNNRYAPFWSTGMGWNIHNEEFMKNLNIVDILRLRGSYGHTGSINFSPYQAITTYKYDNYLLGLYGNGAAPITMGNSDLTWQTTQKFNIGLTSSLFNDRLDFNFDYYRDRTVDMIVPVNMAPSSGVTNTYGNIGEQTNNGFDFTVSGALIQRNDLIWRVSLNSAFNRNKLISIGDALKGQNETTAAVNGSSPLQMFVEGESSTALYVVRSAGIDPASGRELYITKDNVITYEYNPLDKVAVGDSNPLFRGSVSSFLFYKGFSLNVALQYSYGGYIYNETRASRIEQINPLYNADHRAYAERWKEPGDIVNYLTIRPDIDGNITNIHSERFIEKENYLSISYITLGYEFTNKFIEKVGFKRLNVSASMNEMARLSTVRQERGTEYPFARGFSFTISPTF